MQTTAMTVIINYIARKGERPHTEQALIDVSLKMKMVVHFRSVFFRMIRVAT
jgi:hypothetical protein